MPIPEESNPRLSVAMIVRDAADALAETLRSVAAIADEIVVVDTGSTDDTRRIAQQHNAVLLQQAWQDDFSAARNYGWSHLTGDWVLWLDAGERLADEAAEQLRRHLDHAADATKAYMLLVKVPQGGNQIAGEQIGRVRLVPNLHSIRFTGRIREQLTPSLAENHIEVEALPIPIHRGAREHDPQRKQCKARRDLRIAEREMEQCGAEPRPLLAAADALQELGEHQRAADAYREVIRLAPRGSTEKLEAFYGLLTSLDNQEQPDEQLSVCLQALEAYPLDAQLLCAMGGYLQLQGRWDLAARSYQTAFQYGTVNPETWHLGDVRAIAAVCYSLALQLQGKDEQAQQVLEKALQANPQSVRLRRQLIDLHVKWSRRDDALSQWDRLPPDTPHRQALRTAISGACLAAEKDWNSARACLQQAYDQGCRDVLCLRWLSLTLLALGQTAEARPILQQWRKADPASREIDTYLQVASADTRDAPRRFHRIDAADQAASRRPIQPNVTPATKADQALEPPPVP